MLGPIATNGDRGIFTQTRIEDPLSLSLPPMRGTWKRRQALLGWKLRRYGKPEAEEGILLQKLDKFFFG
jgi:hypothetical protein